MPSKKTEKDSIVAINEFASQTLKISTLQGNEIHAPSCTSFKQGDDIQIKVMTEEAKDCYYVTCGIVYDISDSHIYISCGGLLAKCIVASTQRPFAVGDEVFINVKTPASTSKKGRLDGHAVEFAKYLILIFGEDAATMFALKNMESSTRHSFLQDEGQDTRMMS